MIRIGATTFLASLALLAACAPSEPPEAPPPPPPPPKAAKPPPPPVAAAPAPPPDQCGASELASLVGQPRSAIPIPANPTLRRVACTTCPVTMDYNPQRLNIFFEASTGIIKEVKCG